MRTCLSDLIRGNLFRREAGEKSAAQLLSIRPPGGGSRGGQQRTPGGRDSAVLGRGQGQRHEFLSNVSAALTLCYLEQVTEASEPLLPP